MVAPYGSFSAFGKLGLDEALGLAFLPFLIERPCSATGTTGQDEAKVKSIAVWMRLLGGIVRSRRCRGPASS